MKKGSNISILCLLLILLLLIPSLPANAANYPLLVLNAYHKQIAIGDCFYLVGVASNGKLPTFKSSASSIASVNTYGLVTGKKSGTALITAKIKGAEASCQVQVLPTNITVNRSNVSMENGTVFQLSASTSTGQDVTYKSSNKKIVMVDQNGFVTACRPGAASITVSCEGTSKVVAFTVKKPSISLNQYSITLYRTQRSQLIPTISSKLTPAFRSSKSSVATVNEYGYITAVKHGTADIKVTLDGVTKVCKVTVASPTITLNFKTLTLKVGQKATLKTQVSSGNQPIFTSSNSEVVSINEQGIITALKKGKAYLYASEDGTKVSCQITVP